MNPLYEALPVFAQNVACTGAGWMRSRQRFTPHFWRTLDEWGRSMSEPEELLRARQARRLAELLHHARTNVPYFASLPSMQSHADPATAIASTLAQIAPLEKACYRDRPEALLARNIPRWRLMRANTSGTTGTALRLWYTREALAEEYATVWRMRRSLGVSPSDPHMTFGGRMVVPFQTRDAPDWRQDWSAGQTLFSLYHMTPETLPAYVKAVHATDARYAQGYPSSLHLMARALLDAGRPLPRGRLRAVFASSETVLAFQREAIELAFGAPLFDRYGASEFAVSMTGCSAEKLHVDMEYCIVEVEATEETDEYVRGSLLVTGLSNFATPFIRYRIGDIGTRLKKPCTCGRAGDVFESVDGRIEDYVVTPDGRMVGRLDHIFKQQSNVAEAQIVQDRRDRIRVLVVPAPSWSDHSEAELTSVIRMRLGDEIGVEIFPVPSIAREPNGKFRAVKSYLGNLSDAYRLAESYVDPQAPPEPVVAITGADARTRGPDLRILLGNSWAGGYLDEHRPSGALRIRVLGLATCAPLEDLYFVRKRSVRRVWGHFREVGPLWLGRKIVSRFSEFRRNEKFVSVGIGLVIESDDLLKTSRESPVLFVAPCSPRAMERIVVPELLTSRWTDPLPQGLDPRSVSLADGSRWAAALSQLAGWSPYSGAAIAPAVLRAALEEAATAIRSINWGRARRLPAGSSRAVRERDGSPREDKRPSAALFGYGHYARTIVLNGVGSALHVRAVHEIDASLLPRKRSADVLWDTSPEPRNGERHEAYLIASFHHTHAPLALHALRLGAAAVVEKPLVTDAAQLAGLLAELARGNGRFFAGFHKRYSPLNELAREDLGRSDGEPIHYHCVVFEEPLPARHWYRWPNSQSRIISNGCHWLDHFLFLNGWSEPVALDLARGGPGLETANVSVRLENGAFFSMLLTEVGSGRIGVRDYVELRAGDATVTIENGSRYVAENADRVLRRASVNKMTSYERMYRTIASRITSGDSGDSIRSIDVSSRLVLAAEQAFIEALESSRG